MLYGRRGPTSALLTLSVLLRRDYGSIVKDSTRLLLAAAVLVVGLAAAFAMPPGTCPHGLELVEDPAEPGTYSCRILYDVFTAARSLMVLKYIVGIVSMIAAVVLAVPVLVRRHRVSLGMG